MMYMAEGLDERKRGFQGCPGKMSQVGLLMKTKKKKKPSEARLRGQASPIIIYHVFLCLVYFQIPFWTPPNRFFQDRNDAGGREVLGSITAR